MLQPCRVYSWLNKLCLTLNSKQGDICCAAQIELFPTDQSDIIVHCTPCILQTGPPVKRMENGTLRRQCTSLIQTINPPMNLGAKV